MMFLYTKNVIFLKKNVKHLIHFSTFYPIEKFSGEHNYIY